MSGAWGHASDEIRQALHVRFRLDTEIWGWGLKSGSVMRRPRKRVSMEEGEGWDRDLSPSPPHWKSGEKKKGQRNKSGEQIGTRPREMVR